MAAGEHRQKVEKERNFTQIFKFEVAGDIIVGKLLKLKSDCKTKYGGVDVLDIEVPAEDGELVTVQVLITAGLTGYKWLDMIGKRVELTYIGDKVNDGTGQTYKDFEVFVD